MNKMLSSVAAGMIAGAAIMACMSNNNSVDRSIRKMKSKIKDVSDDMAEEIKDFKDSMC